jgi:hypothetical protein
MRWLLIVLLAATVAGAEELYNGIRLPNDWPPKVELSRKPLADPPYLVKPPDVINVDVGRQLFVDDFLIEQTTLLRVHHRPTYHPASPVLKVDRPWEGKGSRARAAVFSDGVWFDPKDQTYKMWYWASRFAESPARFDTCLATSKDGIRWEKPELDVVPGTNIVVRDEENVGRNSNTVWLDHFETEPAKRFKMFRIIQEKDKGNRCRVSTSSDGVHWTNRTETAATGDRSTVFHNPFRSKWVYSLRTGSVELGRTRGYCEFDDPLAATTWRNLRPWLSADEHDIPRTDLKLQTGKWTTPASQLYNVDANAYESLMVGLFAIWRGHPAEGGRPKINELCVGYSRDGFHWSRPDRKAFLGVSEDPKAWNWGNVQSAGGTCLVVGDELRFYVGGTGGNTNDPNSVGLATMRRDGFASMDGEGVLTTRPIKFTGKHLFVNLNGEVRVEVVGGPTSEPVIADGTKVRVPLDLSKYAGQPTRLRFHLKRGSLYAFWISPTEAGHSHGYVAAGGPALADGVDR